MKRNRPLFTCLRPRTRYPMRLEVALALWTAVLCLIWLACCGVPQGHHETFPRIELGE